MKVKVMQAIDVYVDDLKERRLLYLRYLKFMPIETCAKELHISRRTAHNLHRTSIIKLSSKFKNLHKIANEITVALLGGIC